MNQNGILRLRKICKENLFCPNCFEVASTSYTICTLKFFRNVLNLARKRVRTAIKMTSFSMWTYLLLLNAANFPYVLGDITCFDKLTALNCENTISMKEGLVETAMVSNKTFFVRYFVANFVRCTQKRSSLCFEEIFTVKE